MDGLTILANGTAILITLVLGAASFANAPRRTVLVAFGVLLLWLLMGCSVLPGKTYAELGVGMNASLGNSAGEWDNCGSPGFYGGLRQEWDLDRDRFTTFAQYSHYSQYLCGPPFNDKAESSLDHIGVGIRWRLDHD